MKSLVLLFDCYIKLISALPFGEEIGVEEAIDLLQELHLHLLGIHPISSFLINCYLVVYLFSPIKSCHTVCRSDLLGSSRLASSF